MSLWRLAWTLLLATANTAADYGHCVFPLGLESGNIPDTALSASSSFEDSTTGPQNARVRVDRAGGAWCPKGMVGRESSEWLEVDLGAVHTISAVETQGRFGNGQGVEFAEAYFIEYYRPRLARWVRYRSLNGSQVQTGNSNTYLAVKNELWPAITASRIRIVPFSQHKRTVCVRLELYGCQYEGGLLSYSMGQGDRLGRGDHALELVDWNYDGIVANNRLVGGLGALTDGNRGPDDFKMAFYPQNRGWVGWKRPSSENNVDPFVDIVFEFDSARQFHSAHVFSSNQFSRDVSVFRKAVATFSTDGENFGDAVTHVPMEDPVLEEPRNVSVRLHGRVATHLNLRLYFATKWMIVSEVTFDSSPASAEMVLQRAANVENIQNVETEAEAESPSVLVDESVEDAVLMPVVVGVLTTVVLVLAVVLVLIVCKSRRVAKWRANNTQQHTQHHADDDESARMVCEPGSLLVSGSLLPSPYPPYAFCTAASTSESSSANNNSLKSSGGVATPLARRGTPTVYFPPPPSASLPKLPAPPMLPAAQPSPLSHFWQEAEYAEPNVDLSNSLSSSGAYAEPYAATTLLQQQQHYNNNSDSSPFHNNMVHVGSVGHVQGSPRFGGHHPPLTPRRLQHQKHLLEDPDYRSSSDSSSNNSNSTNNGGGNHKRPGKRVYRSYQRKDSDSDHRKMSHRRRQN